MFEETYVIELSDRSDTNHRTLKGTYQQALDFANYWLKLRGGRQEDMDFRIYTLAAWTNRYMVSCTELLQLYQAAAK